VTYKYKETVYKIFVNNDTQVSNGIKSIYVDDKLSERNGILLKNDNKEHIIVVNMGGTNDNI
jgi:hypothetical protein